MWPFVTLIVKKDSILSTFDESGMASSTSTLAVWLVNMDSGHWEDIRKETRKHLGGMDFMLLSGSSNTLGQASGDRKSVV